MFLEGQRGSVGRPRKVGQIREVDENGEPESRTHFFKTGTTAQISFQLCVLLGLYGRTTYVLRMVWAVFFSTIFRHLEANTCRNFELDEDFGFGSLTKKLLS